MSDWVEDSALKLRSSAPLELNQIGTGNRNVVAISKATKKRKRLQFLLLLTLSRTVDGHINIKIADAKAHHSALYAAAGGDTSNDDTTLARSQPQPFQERFHLGSIKAVVSILDDHRLARFRL